MRFAYSCRASQELVSKRYEDIEMNKRTHINDAPCFNCDNRRAQLTENGLSERASAAAVDIDDAMGTLRRAINRRELLRHAIVDLHLDIDMSQLLIVHTIHLATHENKEVTVGSIAEHLGIDPSRASRLVAEAVDAGLARRVASQADARRICLEMTDKARAYEDAIYAYKAVVYSDSLGTWDDEELVVFAGLFQKFSKWVAEFEIESDRDERIVEIRDQIKKSKSIET